MTVIQNVLQQLSGKQILESLEERMTQLIPDFVQARERYENAMAVLEGELGTAAVRKEGEAIAGQMGAMLLFCGALGLRPMRIIFSIRQPAAFWMQTRRPICGNQWPVTSRNTGRGKRRVRSFLPCCPPNSRQFTRMWLTMLLV